MGQRSQIYVAVKRSEEINLDGVITKRSSNFLAARYYQWNYGSRMVSRARYLVEWLAAHAEYIGYELDKIERVADINFDLKDVVISTDCIKEQVESGIDVFYGQPNNDGKLFIVLEKDGTIKYAFTDWGITKTMTTAEYMKWGKYESEIKDGSHYTSNRRYLDEVQLMTLEEVKAFISTEYVNAPKREEK